MDNADAAARPNAQPAALAIRDSVPQQPWPAAIWRSRSEGPAATGQVDTFVSGIDELDDQAAIGRAHRRLLFRSAARIAAAVLVRAGDCRLRLTPAGGKPRGE